MLDRVQLLDGRLHDVAELRGGGHGDVRAILAPRAQNDLVLLILLLVILVVQLCNLLCDRNKRGLALARGAVRGLLNQPPLLRELLVELGVLFVGAAVLRSAAHADCRGVADGVVLVHLLGLASLRLPLGRLAELGLHLIGGVVVGLQLQLGFEGVLLAQRRQNGQLLLRVRLIDGAADGPTADDEACRCGVELVVLVQDVLVLLSRVIVDLLAQRLVVLGPLGIGHAHVGELVRLVYEVAILVEQPLVTQRHDHALALPDGGGIVAHLDLWHALQGRLLAAGARRHGRGRGDSLHGAILVPRPVDPICGTALALLLCKDVAQSLAGGKLLVGILCLLGSLLLLGVLRHGRPPQHRRDMLRVVGGAFRALGGLLQRLDAKLLSELVAVLDTLRVAGAPLGHGASEVDLPSRRAAAGGFTKPRSSVSAHGSSN
mmetsp:Transcript_51691/g.131292  ORF Transcript_51691/g.131292 Transcript_51691/m.131292 type:complete len:432 (-) Transcript_51691:18-1313(-)